ncbi:DNA (cytosine-5)-methyltransferase 1 [Catenulispora sp. GAS73]|uniref:DNA cytosine methyltransferase n=1 Tax=Catenulispora sp. GAS73 TaxID=3156269 RepID=UPI0035135DD2
MITIGSLCSGYGGLDLAVRSVLGGRVVWHAENDRNSIRVLAHRWPGIPNFGDITAVDWSAVPLVDVITAGFPCKDISVAGLGAGIEGERSGIWRNVAEAVRVLRPALVFVENVAALRTRGLDRVAGDLAREGYDAAWLCLRASDIGAPHQRNRLFLLAWPAVPDAEGLGRHEGLAEAEVRQRARLTGLASDFAANADGERGPGSVERWAGRRVEPAHGSGPAADALGLGVVSEDDAAPETERDAVSGGGVEAGLYWAEYTAAVRRWEALTRPAPAALEPNTRGDMRLSARFVEWMMGLPDGFVVDVPDLPRTAKFRILGDGVVPQQAVEALRLLLIELLGAI